LAGGVSSARLSIARETLKSAWNDVYFDSFRWAIIKSWRAAREALEALLEAGGLGAEESWPLTLMAISAPGCMEGLKPQAATLDYLNLLASDLNLYLIVYYGSGGPRKAEAMRALEASLALVEASGKCIERGGLRAFNMAARAAAMLRDYVEERGDSATLIRLGSRLMVIDPEYEELEPLERADKEAPRLPPGLTPLLLSPSEAYALANLPGWKPGDDSELLSDPLRLGRIIV
jgi:hypothetical protein